MEVGEVLLVGVVLVAWLYFVWRRRGREMMLLATRGEIANGKIIRLHRVPMSRTYKGYRMQYRFVAADGRVYDRELEIMPKEFKRFHEGEDIAIIYDPENPKVSALKDVVDQVKQASAERGRTL